MAFIEIRDERRRRDAWFERNDSLPLGWLQYRKKTGERGRLLRRHVVDARCREDGSNQKVGDQHSHGILQRFGG